MLPIFGKIFIIISICGFSTTFPLEKTQDVQEILESTTSTEFVEDINATYIWLEKAIFGVPDNETTAMRVANYDPDLDKVNPEELGSYLEGDMLIPTNQFRNGMLEQSLRWPNGIVPFEIDGDFNAREMALLEQGINEYHKKTCIRFKPRTNEEDYVVIGNENTGCWSSVGRVGGRQELNLQSSGCLRKIGTFLHEMMHALGFLHEQNRYERDNYITIKWDNIKSNSQHNFDKASSKKTFAFNVPYDYGSIMHYSTYAFSKNGEKTIITKKKLSNPKIKIGQRIAFSDLDLKKIRRMYGCDRPDYEYFNSEYENFDEADFSILFPIPGDNKNQS